MGDENTENFRSAVLNEPAITSGAGVGVSTSNGILRTPYGNVRALPPALPPPPTIRPTAFGGQPGAYLPQSSFGYMNSPFMNTGGYGGYSNGYSTFGGAGFGGYSNGGMYGRFGMNPSDPEQKFIQLAENSSRPAFQSIESLVSAIGNIAQMLDSTFFALTSSFRAILGVAANFGRLRTVFGQFWHTFAIFRGLTWIYRKILYWLRISKLDPSSVAFREAFAAALKQSSVAAGKSGPGLPRGPSAWPVLAFISFIFTAPYLIMKLIGTVSETALEETRNPEKWVNPIEAAALYDFQARSPSELSFRSGQRILVAPKEIQNTHNLMATGWGLATIDGQTTGLVPINYLKTPTQMRQQIHPTIPPDNSMPLPSTSILDQHPQLPGLGVNDFAMPPQMVPSDLASPSLSDHGEMPLVN